MNAIRVFIENKLSEVQAKIPDDLRQAVIQELEYALNPPEHEGLFPAYGALIGKGPVALLDRMPEEYSGRAISLSSEDEMRSMSDGIRSFYCRKINANTETASFVFLCRRSFESEVSLFSLRDHAVFKFQDASPHLDPEPENDLMVVQRRKTGEVVLLCCSGIIVIRGLSWRKKIYQYELGLEELCATAIGSKSHPAVTVYRSLARVALHILGARRIGATIIVDETPLRLFEGEQPILDQRQAISLNSADLKLTSMKDQLLIAHLLTHCDGAAIFNSDGQLISIKNWLSDTKEDNTDSDTAMVGGARQRSARMASRRISLPVVTVSADGPVRIFHRGILCKSDDKSLIPS